MGHKIDVITGQETVSSGAGGVAPAVVADVPVLTGAGVRFSAVVEVHASAVELDDDVLVVQASEQRAVCSTDPGSVVVADVPVQHHQYNMKLLRRTPGRFVADLDVWLPPGSGRNKHACRKCCMGVRSSQVIAPGPRLWC